jgi:hypothetical protein
MGNEKSLKQHRNSSSRELPTRNNPTMPLRLPLPSPLAMLGSSKLLGLTTDELSLHLLYDRWTIMIPMAARSALELFAFS